MGAAQKIKTSATKSKNEKGNTLLIAYNVPDQYEIAAGVRPEGYFRRWVRCSSCGFCYSQYSRDEGVIDKIYHTSYRSKSSAWRDTDVVQMFEKIIRLPESESETKSRIRWIKDRLAELYESAMITKKGGLLLDIGGGNGIFAYEFQDKEWRSHVIDPDENGRFMEERFGIPFVQGNYVSGSFGFKFDLISLNFVLEHLPRPDIILGDVQNDMQNGALVYIEVPDAISFEKKKPEDDIFNSCHLWMFSPNTLTRLLDACGLEVFVMNRSKSKRGNFILNVLAGRRIS